MTRPNRSSFIRLDCYVTLKSKSLRIDCSPVPSVAALTTAANSDSPLLKAKTPIVLDYAFTNCPLHIATPPTVDFLVEWHPQASVEDVARRSLASGKSSRLQNLSIVFSPTLGTIQRTVHRLSQFPAHAWLLCLGILVRQSDVDVADCISVEVGSTHVSGGTQERVLNSKHVFLTRHTEKNPKSLQRRCCREDRFDSFVAHLRTKPDANGNVGLRRYLSWYRPI